MTFFLISSFILMVFWRPQEWLIPFLYGYNILDALFYMSLLSFALETQEGRLRLPTYAPQLYLPAGLWFAALMSHIAHTYFAGLMDTIVPTLKFCFFAIILFSTLDRPSRLRAVSRMFVLMAATMALHAGLQQSRGFGFAEQECIIDDKGLRSLFFGIFEDPNDLAQMFVVSIPFGFVCFKRSRLLNFILGSLMAWLLVYGVVWTRSRGAFMGLGAMGLFMIALILPARWLPRIAVIGGAVALCLTPLSGGMMDDSAHDRVAFWGEANWAFKRSPLFGVGYGMIADYISGARAVHNAFVLCYSEIGIFGYWFWFSLLLLGGLGCWRTRMLLRKTGGVESAWLRGFAGMGIAALVGFSGTSYFLTRAFIYPAFFLFAACGAVPVVAGKLLPGTYPRLLDIRRDLYRTCTIASLASVFYIYFSIILLNKAWGGG